MAKSIEETERQKKLYEFLTSEFDKDNDKYLTHDDICTALSEYYSMNHKAVSKMCCSNIQYDVIRINQNPNFENIIIFKNQTYKIAKDAKEANKFLEEKYIKRQERAWKRYWILRKKVKEDGNMKLDTNLAVNTFRTNGEPRNEL